MTDVWPTYNPETHSLYDHQTHVAVRRVSADTFYTSVSRAGWRSTMAEIGYVWVEPTQAERIASETGLTVEQVQAVLDANDG